MKKRIAVLLMASAFLIACFPLSSSAVGTDGVYSVKYDGINIARSSHSIVIYNSDYEEKTTGTDENGIEFVVDSQGIIVSISSGNSTIPKDGLVVSAAGSSANTLSSKAKIGYGIFPDESTGTLYIVGEGYNPFYTSSLTYTGINITRAADTLIIYRGRTSTDTNQYGYEVVCDANGIILSVGGNNSIIPEGGFVLSAHGTYKSALTSASQVGMMVTIDEKAKTADISFNKESAVAAAKSITASWKKEIEKARVEYKNINYEYAEKMLELMNEESMNISKCLEDEDENNMYRFFVAQSRFESYLIKIKTVLVETPAVEGRAIWLRPTQKTQASVENAVKQIFEWGFNIVCIEILYDNTMIIPMPEESLFETNPSYGEFDVLESFITECHKYGIELHAWMSVYRVGHDASSYPSLGLANKKPEWRLISNTGIDYVENEYGNGHFLNPALDEVNDYLISVYEHLITNYSVDGLQLDYIRYPENGIVDYGYDDYTVSLFEDRYGSNPSNFTSSSSLWYEWCEFRASFVTAFVERIKEMCGQVRPDIYLACDVAPKYGESLTRMMQDTRSWLSDGKVDIVYPMAYGTTDLVKINVADTVSFAGDEVYTYIGLSDNGSSDFFDQIVASRQGGADGIAFFAYAQYLAGDYDVVASTIFRKKALSPTYNAKNAAIAQLEYILSRIEKVIVPSEVAGSRKLGELIPEGRRIIAQLENSALSSVSSEINHFAESVGRILDNDIPDAKMIEIVAGDIRTLVKITALSKDDAKSIWYQTHPLPTRYDVSEEDTEYDSLPSDASSTTVELTTAEKVFQIIGMGILLLSLIAIPYYLYLASKKKKEKQSASSIEPPAVEDASEEETTSTEDEE